MLAVEDALPELVVGRVKQGDRFGVFVRGHRVASDQLTLAKDGAYLRQQLLFVCLLKLRMEESVQKVLFIQVSDLLVVSRRLLLDLTAGHLSRKQQFRHHRNHLLLQLVLRQVSRQHLEIKVGVHCLVQHPKTKLDGV